MFLKLEDGSIVDEDGKFLFFTTERFISEIVNGNSCIICGSNSDKKEFNDEHVLPQWILRKFSLFDKSFVLPNGSSFSYGRYTIPCCIECNQKMAKSLEEPISEILSKGLKGISDYLKNKNPWPVFVWLTLIFFKVHYKDRNFRYHLDRRQPSHNISELYEWEELHHLNCISRSFYTSCILEKSVIGSLLVLPAKSDPPHMPFDFLTLYKSQSILLKLDNVAFISILNDSCATLNLCWDYLERLRGPLSTLQLREVLAVLSNANLCLKKRPRFGSRFNYEKGQYVIFADKPEKIEVKNPPSGQYGQILHYCCQEFLPFIKREFDIDIENYLKEGRWTFLFDQNGDFVANSL
jgi:hypothetical protein